MNRDPKRQKRPVFYDASIDAWRIELTKGMQAIVSSEDVAAVGRYNWCALEVKVGFPYAMRKKGTESIYLHRFIASRKGSLALGMDVDHVNGNTLDCRRENIRVCTRRQNNLNSVKRRTAKKSRYKGVQPTEEGRWSAYCDGTYVGTWDSEEEAALAYNRAALRIYGEFAKPNKVVEL